MNKVDIGDRRRVYVMVEDDSENVVNWTEVVGTFLIYSKRLLNFLAL